LRGSAPALQKKINIVDGRAQLEEHLPGVLFVFFLSLALAVDVRGRLAEDDSPA
jgi:hypothetical protein